MALETSSSRSTANRADQDVNPYFPNSKPHFCPLHQSGGQIWLLVKTDRRCITKTHRKSKTLVFEREGRDLHITAKLTFMTQVGWGGKRHMNQNRDVDVVGEQMNGTQRQGVLHS